jgi:hypothetical protein
VANIKFTAFETALVVTEELVFIVSETGRVVTSGGSVVAVRFMGRPCSCRCACTVLGIYFFESMANVLFDLRDKVFAFGLPSAVNVMDFLGPLCEICDVICTFQSHVVFQVIIQARFKAAAELLIIQEGQGSLQGHIIPLDGSHPCVEVLLSIVQSCIINMPLVLFLPSHWEPFAVEFSHECWEC